MPARLGRVRALGGRQQYTRAGNVGAASHLIEAQPVGAGQPLEQVGGGSEVTAKP